MKLLYLFKERIDPIKPNGNQIAVAEGDPAGGFKGKLITAMSRRSASNETEISHGRVSWQSY